MTAVTGKARTAGVIGWPIDHSRSPQLHNYWLAKYDIDGAYVPLAVSPDNLIRAVRGLAALGFAGANVTIPHKEAVMGLIDDVDDVAQRIGAVNTIVVDGDGRLLGKNTDGFGFLENLKEGAPQWRAAAGPAVILGAGGAAKAIAVALSDAGVPEIRIVNRTVERAQKLTKAIGGTLFNWENRVDALEGAALLVNATALGMTGHVPLEIDLERLPEMAVVNDIVYAPLETPLLADAKARGNPVVEGLGMLLHQGRPGFRSWFGVDPQVDDALRAHVLNA